MQNARCGCETRKRRQAEGIAIAKKSGIYTGRKPDLKRSEVIRTLRETEPVLPEDRGNDRLLSRDSVPGSQRKMNRMSRYDI